MKHNFIGQGNFQIDQEAGLKILKVAGWTILSAVVTLLLSAVKIIDFPPQFVWVVPLINTVLVALYQWISDQTKY